MGSPETTQKKVSPAPLTLAGWFLTLHKHDDEWRGQGILSRAKWGPPTRICGEVGMLAAELRGGDRCPRLGIVSLHLPPKATVEQTQSLLGRWGECRHFSHP